MYIYITEYIAPEHSCPTTPMSQDIGTKRGSILLVFMTKRSRGVFGAMRCNRTIRVQQSRASGTVDF